MSAVFVDSIAGLGAASGKRRLEVLGSLHDQISRTLLVRQAALDILMTARLPGGQTQRRTIRTEWDRSGRHLLVVLDPPVYPWEAPEWAPLDVEAVAEPDTLPEERTTRAFASRKVLSNVSKMECPSFSLPAGPGTFLGTCPGSPFGLTVSDIGDSRRRADIAQAQRAAFEDDLGWYDSAICQRCYALKGQYQFMHKQLHGLAILAWTQHALSTGEFVPAMVEAIERSPFHKGLDTSTGKRQARFLRRLGYARVFRIHDAGDFFSREYVRAWRAIADHFLPGRGPGTPTLFWAPTRTWAAGPAVRSWLEELGPAGDLRTNNIVVRPSSYHVGVAPPTPMPYESSGSTAHRPGEAGALRAAGVFDYDCPAGNHDGGNSCLTARGPDGARGCRACWVRPEWRISYREH